MGLGDLGGLLKLVGTLAGIYLLLLWAASVIWALRDIRSRTVDPATRLIGVAVVALMPLLGVALYLIVRPSMTMDEAYEHELEQQAMRSELHLLSACPTCSRPIERDFVVCPYCRTVVREACANCRQLLASEWRHCPYCGASRAPREAARPARAARPATAEIEDGPPPPRQRPVRRIDPD